MSTITLDDLFIYEAPATVPILRKVQSFAADVFDEHINALSSGTGSIEYIILGQTDVWATPPETLSLDVATNTESILSGQFMIHATVDVNVIKMRNHDTAMPLSSNQPYIECFIPGTVVVKCDNNPHVKSVEVTVDIESHHYTCKPRFMPVENEHLDDADLAADIIVDVLMNNRQSATQTFQYN